VRWGLVDVEKHDGFLVVVALFILVNHKEEVPFASALEPACG
jgi:hypothetical protein